MMTAEDDEDRPGRLLQQAALYDNVDLVQSLLQGSECDSINNTDSFGRTALYTSVTNNSFECAHLLLQAGADPNIQCGPQVNCMSPLHVAAAQNKHKFISLLMDFGADPDVRDQDHATPLNLAIENDNEECSILLLERIERKKRETEQIEQKFMKAVMDGNVQEADENSKKLSTDIVTKLVNSIPQGQNSLIFRSCENGHIGMVEFLLSKGSMVRVHPVTGYSPLHAACHTGNVQCARIVLQHFPELIGAPTIEGTFPLHMACAEGQTNIIKLLLQFPYPELVSKLYKENTGNRMFRLGLPLNSRDGHGRTPLHVAAMSDKPEVVRQLLRFKVPVVSRYHEGNVEHAAGEGFVNSLGEQCEDDKKGEQSNFHLDGCQTLPRKSAQTQQQQHREEISPIEVDMLDLDGNTPLHIAVKGNGKLGYHRLALLLLQNKANPNKPFITPMGNSNPLMEACHLGDLDMMALLLKYGARDDNLNVLKVALKARNWDMVGAIIQHRSHADSEIKINVHTLVQLYNTMESDVKFSERFGGMTTSKLFGDRFDSGMTSSKIFKTVWPSQPVVINWHSLNLPQLEVDWIYKACWQLTGRPPPDVDPKLTLVAVTRIDLSDNHLTVLPPEVFEMPSLKTLNASKNQIEDILFEQEAVTPTADSVITKDQSFGSLTSCTTLNDFNLSTPPSKAKSLWESSVLEEINLQKNKLRSVPSNLFKLPSLVRANLSYNCLESLPFALWSSATLSELNLSHNNLSILPLGLHTYSSATSPGIPILGTSPSQDSASLSSFGSPASFDFGTPKGLSYLHPSNSPVVTSVTLRNGREVPVPPSSLPLVAPSSVNIMGAQPSPVHPYQELSVTYLNHWAEKVRIQTSTDNDSHNTSSDYQSKLSEVNLSYNSFQSMPQGLSCLAPNLSKLNLSHNKLTQIGPLDFFPANLKWLDLSSNDIMSDTLFELESSGSLDLTPMGSFSLKSCYNPAMQSKQIKSINRTSSTPRINRLSRPSSASSVQSVVSSSSAGAICCPHRYHRQLDKLKTLKLSNNKLSKLALTVHGKEEEIQSSSEEGTSQNAQAPSSKRDSIISDTSLDEARELLYPALSQLEVSSNCLLTLDPEIRLLSQLAELKISGNRLKELPSELGLLKKLWNLDFSGCPVEKSLQALLGEKAKKTATVLSYLKSIKEQATLYNRMKLMLVGIQGIGKTSLLAQLRKEGKSSSYGSKNWAQRMGHSTSKDKDLKGENISTVGVDIGDLVLQRASKEVVFSTWDFGGQREYYATHQYFLSKRSLYLVLWRVTDGEKGIHEILQWLVNIQARAPNSPVIIVGTHTDLINKKKHPPSYLSDLQRRIVEKYMNHTEPEKSGLPRVLGHIEISCKSRLMFNNHIGDLVNMIWDCVWEEPLPGNKGAKLLDQKVPSTYVQLQEVVRVLARERKDEGKDPVLHAEQYKPLVIQKMEELFSTSFRDVVELSQATQFLHENGVLLHYDDVNLQDIYFLDPQWLCDVLASVVTIREINSLAKCGIMRADDLKILFKNAAFKPEDIRAYIINLLSKFEVALRWNQENLLIPSLLPSETDMMSRYPGSSVRIPMRSSKKSGRRNMDLSDGKPIQSVLEAPNPEPNSGKDSTEVLRNAQPNSSQTETQVTKNDPLPKNIVLIEKGNTKNSVPASEFSFICGRPNSAVAIVRLYVMSYFPSGFWPRLITRLLGDDTITTIALRMYDLQSIAKTHTDLRSAIHVNTPEWISWQSGLQLVYLGVTLLKVREVATNSKNNFCDYRKCSLVIKQDQDLDWQSLTLENMSVLEIIVPNQTVTVLKRGHKTRPEDSNKPTAATKATLQSTTIQPCPQYVAGLLAKIVDHVDTLLEDWYPDLGARFIQNARGMYLISRIVPCTRCLLRQIEHQRSVTSKPVHKQDENVDKAQVTVDSCEKESVSGGLFEAGQNVYTGIFALAGYVSPPPETTEPHVSNVTKSPSTDRLKAHPGVGSPQACVPGESNVIYCYLAEQCLQAAQMNKIVYCLEHGNLGPYFIASTSGRIMAAHVAPDSVFQDIGQHYLVNEDCITRGKFLGRGSFGAVYAGTMVDKDNGKIPIALKMLEPVKPERDECTSSLMALYQAEKQRWSKDPMKSSCEAYLNARKELTILLSLHHENIVPLLGITLHPLSLVLSLAPGGALSEQLKDYVRAGARLKPLAIAEIIKQVAAALHYLHTCPIIYRDLKAENVLVWSLPAPHEEVTEPVGIKLADYGVSRCVLQSGTKGLAGTPPFIAPEIIQHNGEEPYTEKVDIFSFGMFMFELLVLKLPFDGEENVGGANMKGHILSGARPHLTEKDIHYPTHILDLMTLCWAHDPNKRPSAQEILSLASRPEFSHLYNVIPLSEGTDVSCACSSPNFQAMTPFMTPQEEFMPLESSTSRSDVWLATRSQEPTEGGLMIFTFESHDCVQAKHIPLGTTIITSMCVTDENIWAADTSAVIHVFRLSDYSPLLKFPATTRPNVKVVCMTSSLIERQVYVVLDNGRFIVCEVDFPVNISINYSPVKTECPGNGKPIISIGVIMSEIGSSELWCGQTAGRVSVWNLHSTQGSLKRMVHFQAPVEGRDVVHLETCRGDSSAVWTYVSPGVRVYRWDALSKTKESYLDIAAVFKAPAHDPEQYRVGAWQVTAMSAFRKHLLISTEGGFVIAANKMTLAPLSIMGNGSDASPSVSLFVPLYCVDNDDDVSQDTDSDSVVSEMTKMLGDKKENGYAVCISKGYEDIVRNIGLTGGKLEPLDQSLTYLTCFSTDSWVGI